MTHEGDSNMISNVLKKTAFLPSRLELFFGGSCHIYRNLYLTKTSHFNHLLVRTGGFWSVNSPIGLRALGPEVWFGQVHWTSWQKLCKPLGSQHFRRIIPPEKDSVGFRSPNFGWFFCYYHQKNTMEHAGIKNAKGSCGYMTTWCFFSKGGESKCGGWWTFI